MHFCRRQSPLQRSPPILLRGRESNSKPLWIFFFHPSSPRLRCEAQQLCQRVRSRLLPQSGGAYVASLLSRRSSCRRRDAKRRLLRRESQRGGRRRRLRAVCHLSPARQLCAAGASVAAAAPPPASRLSRPEGSTPSLPCHRGPEPDSRTVERLRGEALTPRARRARRARLEASNCACVPRGLGGANVLSIGRPRACVCVHHTATTVNSSHNCESQSARQLECGVLRSQRE